MRWNGIMVKCPLAAHCGVLSGCWSSATAEIDHGCGPLLELCSRWDLAF